jgi:hypothetical protein
MRGFFRKHHCNEAFMKFSLVSIVLSRAKEYGNSVVNVEFDWGYDFL